MIHTEASLSRGKQGSRWALLSVTALVTMMISMGVGTPGLAAPATPDAGGSTTRADVGIRAATPENTGADATRAKTDRNATADKTADKATRTADATAAAPTGKAAPSASPSPAPSASKSVAKREARVQVEAPVTAASTDPQTITFPPQADLPMGTTGRTLNATAESGLPVSYTSTTMAVCTVTAGGVVTPVHVGTCTIEADQAGNGTWAPAPTAPGSFPVVKGDQTISFPAPGGVAMGTSASLDATASSGLAVAYTSTTTAVCTVTQEGVVTPVQVGTCTIQAEQDGDPDWNAATATSANFAITKGTQTITFGPLSDKLVTDAAFTVTAATSAPGLSVTFSSTDEAVCTVADGTVTLVAAGTCAIKAEQPGDANWKTATPVTQTFQVNRLAQSITFGPLADVAIGASPLTLGATASSGQAVVLTSTTTPVCTIAGNTVTLVAAGTCTIKAEQAGNATYAPAEPISRSFTVVGDPQTITFGPLADVSFTGGPVTLTATASSGLAVSYTSATTGVCTVASDKVTLVATGTCAIQADQAGDGTYRAAESVTRSFTVTPATQTITFPELADVAMTASPVALNATASSGLPVTYTSTNPEVCEITGALPSGVRGATATSTVTLNGPGTCTIEARQSGNANYQA
ncbi:hypothetical protein, partial [Micromonospora sp. NPDC049679]|uniref:hypothetical protein n=1 Tax=Micromonospora sp. NPDC049679 TaxID=3155920 RepID=UPI0033CB23ED